MDLVLFCVLLALALALITLGLFRSEHTELSIIGFVFLFLLSLTIINQNIDYKIGYETNTTYTYSGGNLTFTNEVTTDLYDSLTLGSDNAHNFGYWLAVVSIIGFVGVLVSLRGQKWR